MRLKRGLVQLQQRSPATDVSSDSGRRLRRPCGSLHTRRRRYARHLAQRRSVLARRGPRLGVLVELDLETRSAPGSGVEESSSGEPHPSTTTPGLQNGSTGSRRHAVAEAMALRPATYVRLEGPLHLNPLGEPAMIVALQMVLPQVRVRRSEYHRAFQDPAKLSTNVDPPVDNCRTNARESD
jgi:hypothetical protein